VASPIARHHPGKVLAGFAMTARANVGFAAPVDLTRSPYARLRPLPVSAVRLEGEFWGARLQRNVAVALPSQWEQLEASGVLDNFRRVAGEVDRGHRGFVFADTDLYKWLEAASWALCGGPDAALERRVDEGLDLIERAQRPDGYLHTYYARERAEARFTDLRDQHELYALGHLLQAAVAHRRATGSERLLRVARRFADLVCELFGPAEAGRRVAVDGHQQVEMGLVELFRETGDRRYLEQAQFFVGARGRGLLDGGQYGRAYYQDHAPFRELESMAGHAVRALYYCAGASDLYLETGDPTLLETLSRLFDRMQARQLYVSGGLGARHEGEAFGLDHELPNARAYTETCAAVGSMMWCHRMLAATGEPRFADLLETTLFNALLPGWSLDGQRYFYVNPLQDGGAHRRQPWHRCACCPPNVARTLASLPGYLYGARADALYVHLYAEGAARVELGGREVRLSQRTRYPWDGTVALEVDGEGEFALHLRIPGWCEEARVTVNGSPLDVPRAPGTYAEVRRRWRRGDRVELALEMPVRAMECHPHVLENAGRLALARGPLLYCLEGVDHPGAQLLDLALDPRDAVEAEWAADLLGGVVALRGRAELRPPGEPWRGRLYRRAGTDAPRERHALAFTAVPYFAWANRAPGQLQVWLRRAVVESESST
jgi:DUF1680 family protein